MRAGSASYANEYPTNVGYGSVACEAPHTGPHGCKRTDQFGTFQTSSWHAPSNSATAADAVPFATVLVVSFSCLAPAA